MHGPDPDHSVDDAQRGADRSGHVLRAALADLEVARERPYYDEQADGAAVQAYFADVDTALAPAELRAALAGLLAFTHDRPSPYKPMRLVYPWVDLHPDRKLRSIYSGATFEPEELIREDARVEAERSARLSQRSAADPGLSAQALAAEAEAVEQELLYNCEHVVPQSWFAKDEPMRGDLHHLFACEPDCNSFRGNTPYFDFPDYREVVREACGKREDGRFEPAAGKGPAARATLYFLLRYPGLIDATPQELEPERIELLLAWHAAEPVGEYERHRNMAIFELQGNRNPLIDHPEWAERLDFSTGLG